MRCRTAHVVSDAEGAVLAMRASFIGRRREVATREHLERRSQFVEAVIGGAGVLVVVLAHQTTAACQSLEARSVTLGSAVQIFGHGRCRCRLRRPAQRAGRKSAASPTPSPCDATHPPRPRLQRRLAAAQPAPRLAPLHADAARGAPAAAGDRARRGRLARRPRRPPLLRRDRLVVGQSVRPCRRAHRRGGGRATAEAAARDAGRLHACAGGRAGRAAVGAHRRRARPCLLRQRRRVGGRDRAEDELSPLAQRRPAGQARVRLPSRRLPRRDAGRAGGDRRAGLS